MSIFEDGSPFLSANSLIFALSRSSKLIANILARFKLPSPFIAQTIMPTELEEVRATMRPHYDPSWLTPHALESSSSSSTTEIRRSGKSVCNPPLPPPPQKSPRALLTPPHQQSDRELGPLLQELPLHLQKQPVRAHQGPKAPDQGLRCVLGCPHHYKRR